MADNYLEKKMEEHRNGVRRPSMRYTPSGHKPGFALLPYDIKTAFIESDKNSLLLTAIATAIRETGCRTAISCPNGTTTAQRISCAFVAPGDSAIEALSNKWGEIELVIKIVSDEITLTLGSETSTITKSDSCRTGGTPLRLPLLAGFV